MLHCASDTAKYNHPLGFHPILEWMEAHLTSIGSHDTQVFSLFTCLSLLYAFSPFRWNHDRVLHRINEEMNYNLYWSYWKSQWFSFVNSEHLTKEQPLYLHEYHIKHFLRYWYYKDVFDILRPCFQTFLGHAYCCSNRKFCIYK